MEGELVLLNSKEYTYPMRPHPGAQREQHQNVRTFGHKAQMVRRRFGRGEWWLVLRHRPSLGWPEKELKKQVERTDKGALTYTGQRIRFKIQDSETVADMPGF
jgi:hypothetical protein